MEEFLEFNFVYSNDAVKVKTFLSQVPRNIECINYMDVFNKLTKNDYLQTEPSDAVVSSYLIKQLQTVIDRDTTRSIFYVLSNLHEGTIGGIMDYVESITKKDVVYNIYHSEEVNVNGTAKLFTEVVEFE